MGSICRTEPTRRPCCISTAANHRGPGNVPCTL